MDVEKQNTILVVVAHPREARELEKKLRSGLFKITSRGDFLYNNSCVRLIVSGVGKKKIKSCLRRLLESNKKISAVINVGFAGALDGNIKFEEWILIDRIYNFDDNQLQDDNILAHPDLLEIVRRYLYLNKVPYRVGNLVTAKKAYSDKTDKERLFNKTKSLVVDMEAYFIAAAALKNDIPFISIKIVSDTLLDKAEDTIKARGKSLSLQIAQIIPGLIIKVADKS